MHITSRTRPSCGHHGANARDTAGTGRTQFGQPFRGMSCGEKGSTARPVTINDRLHDEGAITVCIKGMGACTRTCRGRASNKMRGRECVTRSQKAGTPVSRSTIRSFAMASCPASMVEHGGAWWCSVLSTLRHESLTNASARQRHSLPWW